MKNFCIIFLLLLFSAPLFADDDEKLKLAVMEFEDKSGKLSEEIISNATEYIRGAFVSTNKYVVIAKERQEKAMIAEMKKESYKACNDKNCQIPLGQALSADTILRTTITFFAGTYTITSELIDLAKEATVVGAKEDYDGSEISLKHALNEIVKQITGAAAQAVQKEENESANETETETEKEKAKEKPLPKKTRNTNTYHPYKVAGISLMVAGAAVVIGGVAGFHIASDKEYDKYKKMTLTDTAYNAISDGLSESKYVSRAKNHRDTANIYRILEISSGAVGGALVVTGIVLTAIKKKKNNAEVSLSNISVVPADEGFYASLGFEF